MTNKHIEQAAKPAPFEHIIRMMKLTFLFLLTGLLHVSASVFSQQKKISVDFRSATLESIIKEVERKSGYSFVYSNNDFPTDRRISLRGQDRTVAEILDLVLRNTGFSYKLINESVITFTKSAVKPIKGKVVDEKGKPLAGASLKSSDGKILAQTDAEGAFVLNFTAESGTILVSYIGYQEEVINVIPTESNYQITLKESSAVLKGVSIVSTGIQNLSKERSAGSFAKPNMEVFASRTGSLNIIQRLDGLIPGLTINNAPSTSQVLLRGVTTINSARGPLYVVDGFPIDNIASINPNDVEDITVLRDAVATSVWGARASNGVIVITTKKGKADGGLEIEYNGFVNFRGTPDLNYARTLNSEQYIQAARELFNPTLNPLSAIVPNGSLSPALPPHEQILYAQNSGAIDAATANAQLAQLAATSNLQQMKDLWYRDAILNNHTLSLRGGGEKYNVYGSLTYSNNRSNGVGEKNQTYKINVRQDVQFNKILSAYLITDLTNAISSAKNNIFPDSRFVPYALYRDAAGNNLSQSWLNLSDAVRLNYENASKVSLNYNPLDEFDRRDFKSDNMINRIVGGITAKVYRGLKFEGVYGYYKANSKNTTYLDQNNYAVRSELVAFTQAATVNGGLPTYYLPTTGGRFATNNQIQRNWNVRNQLSYDRSFDEQRHQLTVLAGQEIQNQLSIGNSSLVRGYNPDLLTFGSIDYKTLINGINNTVYPNSGTRSVLFDNSFGANEVENRVLSYYGNVGYTFDHKYTLNGNMRLDQSSLFGKDKSAQDRPVGSVGLSWFASREKFLSQYNWLNRLIVRATYGVTGLSPLAGTASSYDIVIAESNAIFPDGRGVRIGTPANRRLSWESTKTINLGLDFAVFNRVSGSIDVYRKNTDNLIGLLPVNPFTGYTSITGNMGSLTNKGVELSLNSQNISNGKFSWSTLFNLAYNRNKITSLSYAAPISTGNALVTQNYMVGYSSFALFAYQYAGLDNLGDPRVYLADGSVTKAINATTPGDIAYMGTYQPVWSGGLSNMFKYGPFSLNANIIYNLGHVMRRDVTNLFSGGRLSATFNEPEEFANRWKVAGDELRTNIPSHIAATGLSASQRNVNYYKLADVNVLDASFIKLRDITLGYELPKSWVSAIRVKAVNLSAQVSNVMLWKANTYGIDPEFQDPTGAINGSLTGGGVRTMPVNQNTVSFSAHINF